jgi:hypothetical protein
LYATELPHLTPAERAMQSTEESDQKRLTAEVAERNRAFSICRGKREGGRVFPWL